MAPEPFKSFLIVNIITVFLVVYFFLLEILFNLLIN